MKIVPRCEHCGGHLWFGNKLWPLHLDCVEPYLTDEPKTKLRLIKGEQQ